MIEEKAQGSVWSVAILAVVLFLAIISFEGVFAPAKVTSISTNVISQ
ncbi:MAG: hypothetical protein COC00_008140 [Rhizobiales bacterium]|nr:hypothetical protein [Hyphomicrobiales bacterium]